MQCVCVRVCVCASVCLCIYVSVCVCVCVMEYYLVIKKNEIMPLAATWTELDMILLSEVSQTEKDESHMLSLICGI